MDADRLGAPRRPAALHMGILLQRFRDEDGRGRGIVDGGKGRNAAERMQWLSIHTDAFRPMTLVILSEAKDDKREVMNGDRDLLSKV